MKNSGRSDLKKRPEARDDMLSKKSVASKKISRPEASLLKRLIDVTLPRLPTASSVALTRAEIISSGEFSETSRLILRSAGKRVSTLGGRRSSSGDIF